MRNRLTLINLLLFCFSFLFFSSDKVIASCPSGNYSCLSGTKYYVSNQGDDSFDGVTPDTAWKTIARLSQVQFQPGDSVYFAAGSTFTEKFDFSFSGNELEPIVITTYGSGEKPVFTQGSFFYNTAYVVLDGVAFDSTDQYCLHMYNASHSLFTNLHIKNCGLFGIRMYSSSYNTISNSQIRDVGQNGIHLYRTATKYKAEGNTFSHNTITNCAVWGISLYGFDLGSPVKDTTVEDNTITGCGDGVYLNWADHNSIRNNTLVSNTNTSRFGEGYGVGVQTSSYNEISGNHIELNRSRGVEIWGGDFKNNEGRTYGNSDGNKIWGNEFVSNGLNFTQASSNEGAGLFISTKFVSQTDIYYNVFRHNAKGVYIINHTGTQNRLFNNVIADNQFGGMLYLNWVNGWQVFNNVFVQNKNYDILANYNSDGTASTFDHQHNAFWPGNLSTLVTYNNTHFTTDILTQFEDSAVQQDPQFVNFAQADFHLRENSSLRDVGAAHEIIQDYDLVSVPVGSGYDIGAFEFSSSLSPSMTPSQSSCVADISGDNRVDLLDYSILVNNFLLTRPIDTRADINADGAVDLKDYSLLVQHFLSACP